MLFLTVAVLLLSSVACYSSTNHHYSDYERIEEDVRKVRDSYAAIISKSRKISFDEAVQITCKQSLQWQALNGQLRGYSGQIAVSSAKAVLPNVAVSMDAELNTSKNAPSEMLKGGYNLEISKEIVADSFNLGNNNILTMLQKNEIASTKLCNQYVKDLQELLQKLALAYREMVVCKKQMMFLVHTIDKLLEHVKTYLSRYEQQIITYPQLLDMISTLENVISNYYECLSYYRISMAKLKSVLCVDDELDTQDDKIALLDLEDEELPKLLSIESSAVKDSIYTHGLIVKYFEEVVNKKQEFLDLAGGAKLSAGIGVSYKQNAGSAFERFPLQARVRGQISINDSMYAFKMHGVFQEMEMSARIQCASEINNLRLELRAKKEQYLAVMSKLISLKKAAEATEHAISQSEKDRDFGKRGLDSNSANDYYRYASIVQRYYSAKIEQAKLACEILKLRGLLLSRLGIEDMLGKSPYQKTFVKYRERIKKLEDRYYGSLIVGDNNIATAAA